MSIQLAYHLTKSGHEAKVVALYVDKDRTPYFPGKVRLIVASKPLDYLFAHSKLFLLLAGFPALLYLTWREAKDANMLNPHNFPSLWSAVLAGSLRRIPVFWTAHNFPQTPFSGGVGAIVLNPVLEFTNGFFARKCKKIFSVSEKVKRQIGRFYKLEAEVVYPAVSFEFWSRGDGKKVREKFGWKDKVVLLCVGRLTREKNQELAIRAFAKITKKVKEAVLVLVGDGEDRGRLEDIVERLEHTKKVFFVGYQPPDSVRDFYAAADLHLSVAYKTEGFNLSPLEALSTRTISVVAEGSGVDEALLQEKIGLVAKPNVESYSSKIFEAFEKMAEISQMGKKGQAWVKKNLSWDRYVDRFEGLL